MYHSCILPNGEVNISNGTFKYFLTNRCHLYAIPSQPIPWSIEFKADGLIHGFIVVP